MITKQQIYNSSEFKHLVQNNKNILDINLIDIIYNTYEEIDIILDEPIMHFMIDKFNLDFSEINFNSYLECIEYIKKFTIDNIFAMFSYYNGRLIFYSTPVKKIKNNQIFSKILKYKNPLSRLKKIKNIKSYDKQ